MLNTIARTGTVLNLFTPECPHWGVTEVASALNLSKSTAHDLLASLAEVGLLQRTPDDRYRLGWRLLVMSRRLVSSTNLRGSIQRTIADVSKQLGAGVTIGAWDGRRVVCVLHAAAPGTAPLHATGTRLPGHASALGKLLMAQLPEPQVEARIRQYGLPALTSRTVVDPDVFRCQLREAERTGVATQHGELVDGRSCLAVGILDSHRRVIAALSICASTERVRGRCEEFAHVARRTVRTLMDQGIAPGVPPMICQDPRAGVVSR